MKVTPPVFFATVAYSSSNKVCAAIRMFLHLTSYCLSFALSMYPTSCGTIIAAKIARITNTTINSTRIEAERRKQPTERWFLNRLLPFCIHFLGRAEQFVRRFCFGFLPARFHFASNFPVDGNVGRADSVESADHTGLPGGAGQRIWPRISSRSATSCCFPG